jgi:energy-coupling factor transport system ATP-binding protein
MIPNASPSAITEKVISIKGLKFTYDGGVQAIRDMNLDIRFGEYLALVGGNGSGKTTLAKNINGLLRPTSGSVVVAGRPTNEQKVAALARIVGYAFQNPDHQLFCSSVEEEVRFGPMNLGYSEQDVRDKVEKAIEAMSLEQLRKLPPLSLRLGERRRVSIASVIAMDPDVLILDEPTTGLDAEESAELMRRLKRLNDNGKTIILITHDMKLVAEHAKRVVVISEGRVLLDSDPRGAFSDLEILRQSNLVPPAVTQLAHRLSAFDVPRDVISPEELVFHLLKARGGA